MPLVPHHPLPAKQKPLLTPNSLLLSTYSLLLTLLTACTPAADPHRGAQRFTALPCAGCHGATAQGQFGPPLAGTALTLDEVRNQVRHPRDQMPAFAPDTVSDRDVADIYAWLQTLPPVTPTPAATLPPAEATTAARNRLFPFMSATDIHARQAMMDEVAFRIVATVVNVRAEGRFVYVDLEVVDEATAVDVAGLYDTAVARQSFPGAPGDRLLLYGVGAQPATPDGNPQFQIIHVRPAPP